jgi:SAM-dependent methyltransferase
VTLPAARAVGPAGHVDALDHSRPMLARLRVALEDEGLTNVCVRPGDATQPPGDPETYQAITAGLVLFLLDDPAGAVRRYARLLVPSGRLAVSTFGAPDPRWRWLLQVHLQAGRAGAFSPGVSPSAGRLGDLLAGAGLVKAVSTERTLRLGFSGPDDWLDWSWSHGQRALWEALEPHQRARARDFAVHNLTKMAEAEGRITLNVRVDLTVASRAAAGPNGKETS